MALTAGTRVGPYEILAALGAGGMGEVYRARDTRLDRDVAVKVLPAVLASDAAALARFEREAKAVAALSHPNILAIHDVGREGSTSFAVMELLDGETLRERLTSGALPPRKAIDYAVQIAHALGAAHERGVVHRDIKPDNIFLTAKGHVKVLDFGLARQDASAAVEASQATVAPATSPGTVLGTVGYMSPEQVRGTAVDGRSDIFSLGVVLYEMLSGRRAFARESAPETMTAILKEEPPELAASGVHIPPALERIVRRCLEKNRAERFHSAHDLGIALETISTESSTMAAGAAVETRRAFGRREQLAWTAAFVLALACAGLAWLTWQSRASTTAVPATYRFQIPTPPMPEPSDFKISPDGRSLAFVALNSAKVPAVWIRPFDQAEPRMLAGSEGARGVFWSPDSRSVGYASSRQIVRQSIDGGPAQMITDFIGQFFDAEWSGDTIVFATFPFGLKGVSAGGGETRTVSSLRNGEVVHTSPTFVGDRTLLFAPFSTVQREVCTTSLDQQNPSCTRVSGAFVGYTDGQVLLVKDSTLLAQGIDLASMSVTGEPRPVLPDKINVSLRASAAFSLSAGVVAFRSGGVDQQRLVWFDRAGKRLDTVSSGIFNNFDLSPDGQRVLFSGMVAENADVLMLIDPARGVTSRVVSADRGYATDPVWSPDGTSFAYTQRRERSRIVVQPIAGGAEKVVFEPPNTDVWVESWSRDGRYIAVGTSQNWQKPRPMIVPVAGGAPIAIPAEGSVIDEYHFSPDGHWLAYNGDASGRQEIYVMPLPPNGEQWQVSSAGGVQARWSGNGQELFYIALDGALMSVAIAPGPVFKASAPRRLFALPSGLGSPFLDEFVVAPDGQRFLVAEPVRTSDLQPINVIVNWAAARGAAR